MPIDSHEIVELVPGSPEAIAVNAHLQELTKPGAIMKIARGAMIGAAGFPVDLREHFPSSPHQRDQELIVDDSGPADSLANK